MSCQAPGRWETSGICGNLAEAVRQEVAAHSAWAKAGPLPTEGPRAQTTQQRWAQVHDLLDQGVGLLDCARRLNLSLNTVKRYARAPEPDRLIRAPAFRPTLVDPYRDYLRGRRAEQPAVPLLRLLREIRQQGYTGSHNLLVRYINSGRLDGDQPAMSPRALTRFLLTRPHALTDPRRDRLDQLTATCPEMTTLASLVREFAALLDPADGNDDRLTAWITTAQTADLPHLHAYTRGRDLDRDAVNNALTLPYSNGGTEGVTSALAPPARHCRLRW